jgi:prefoldin subunit 5
MHGEGRISEEVFTALRALADRGQLRPADLAVHRARAQRRPIHREDRQEENALRAIRSRLDQLAVARKGSEKVLSELQGRITDVDGRIANKASAARGAVGEGDEQDARRRLTEKAQLSSSRDRLARQLQLLKEDLAHLDDLTAQLQNKAVELEAVRARGDLASLGSVEGVQGDG